MAVQQYKLVTNYAPNSELEDDERRRRITLDIPHTCMMLFGTGELFLSAQSVLIHFLFGQIYELGWHKPFRSNSWCYTHCQLWPRSDLCHICSNSLLPVLSISSISILWYCYMTTLANTSISMIVTLPCMTANIFSNYWTGHYSSCSDCTLKLLDSTLGLLPCERLGCFTQKP